MSDDEVAALVWFRFEPLRAASALQARAPLCRLRPFDGRFRWPDLEVQPAYLCQED